MNLPVMIHEMWDNMVIPEGVVLTFDDGLYTQYKHGPTQPHLTKKLFISTNIICNGSQSTEFITAPEAHKKAFAGNKENYMTVEQIRELMDMGWEIGGHSHSHSKLWEIPTMVEQVTFMKKDTEMMLEWFEQNLNVTPTSFCFPYNYNVQGLYNAVLKRYGFIQFYGDERINVYDILV